MDCNLEGDFLLKAKELLRHENAFKKTNRI